MRAMQLTQFCAKSAKNDLKPMDILTCNFHFETEGVCTYCGCFIGVRFRSGVRFGVFGGLLRGFLYHGS